MEEFDTFDSAYRAVVRAFVNGEHSRNSGRGFGSVEMIPGTFGSTDSNVGGTPCGMGVRG